jgi:hypothetical protein
MAFIDNSGDIILDCVLTDTGRFRLAKGNGSFKISKFALGDDEIDYSLYDKTNASGSAYYDLNLLQTPILEAFTNNGSSMKSKLLTITRTNLLYLPVVKLNTSVPDTQVHSSGIHLVTTDAATNTAFSSSIAGIIDGVSNQRFSIRLDQGIDSINSGKTKNDTIDQDLRETQYIVEIDNRFGTIIGADTAGTTLSQAKYSFIDDDNIATYNFSLNVANNSNEYVKPIDPAPTSGNDPESLTVIAGPRGTKLLFSIASTNQLRSNNYLFNTLGSTATINSQLVNYIDTVVRVTGATTGYRVDVPVRFIKV